MDGTIYMVSARAACARSPLTGREAVLVSREHLKQHGADSRGLVWPSFTLADVESVLIKTSAKTNVFRCLRSALPALFLNFSNSDMPDDACFISP